MAQISIGIMRRKSGDGRIDGDALWRKIVGQYSEGAAVTGTRHDLTINGHRLVAYGFNEDQPGTPTVFLHGIFSSPRIWFNGQPTIFNERPWYALTLPGHYPAVLPSGFRREDLTADMIADVVAEAVRQLTGGKKAMLVGHSTGGFAAAAAAAAHPEIASSVVSVSGFAQGTWHGPLRLAQILARLGVLGKLQFRLNWNIIRSSRKIFSIGTALYAADRKAYYAYPNLAATMALLFEDIQHLDLNAMLPYFNRMPDIDISDWLPRINVPVLALTGSHDTIVPREQAALIASRVQQGKLVTIDGAGHLLMWERPDDYARVLTEWVEAVDR